MSKQVKCKIIKPTKPQASALYHMKRKAGIAWNKLDLFTSGNIIARLIDGRSMTITPNGTVRIK